MHPDTGEIRKFLNQEEADAAGFTIPLTDEEAAHCKVIPPGQRVEALARFRGSRILTRAYVPPRRKRDAQ